MFVAKRAVFLEKEYLLQEDNGNKIDLEEVPDSQINDSSLDELSSQVVQDNTQEVWRSGKVPKQPERYVGHITDGNQVGVEDPDPQTYK